MRYYEENALIEAAKQVGVQMKEILKDIQPADVRENKRGEWLNLGFGFGKCSICGATVGNKYSYNYCPQCGAEV